MSANEQKTRAASYPHTNPVCRQTRLNRLGHFFDPFIDGFLVLLCNLRDQKCFSRVRGSRVQHGWTCLIIDMLSLLLLCLGVCVPAEETDVKASGQLSQLEAPTSGHRGVFLAFLCTCSDLCESPAQAVLFFSMTSIVGARNHADAASTVWTLLDVVQFCSTETWLELRICPAGAVSRAVFQLSGWGSFARLDARSLMMLSHVSLKRV